MTAPSCDPAKPVAGHQRAAMARLTRRAEFLRAARGWRSRTGAFTLQMVPSDPEQPARFGLTVSNRMGNSVVRNRIRRRLRAALRSLGGLAGEAGHDYVIVARRELLTIPFAILIEALAGAMRDIHKHPNSPRRGAGSPPKPLRRS
jgi:ribonuclease P protein component